MKGDTVSNTDSFIDEVNEELQRDRLFALIRKYGWIAALGVIVLVGGAAYNEWHKARARAAAEALGDGILTALSSDNSAGALAALAPEAPGAAGLVALIEAANAERDTAIALLADLSVSGDVDPIYRDIAALKRVVLQGTAAPAAARMEALDALSVPGAPFRVLALEHKALILVETGDSAGALEVLSALVEDSETTQGQRQRVTQMIVALGGTV